MGLMEVIASKKMKIQLNNLYCGITDSYIDLTSRVNANKLTKSAAKEMLKVVYESGREDYNNLKATNTNLQDLFIESDKKFNSLFYNIERTMENYDEHSEFTMETMN